MEKKTGTVKWFDVKKGLGFIIPHAGGRDVFVWHAAIAPRQPGFKLLETGQSVEYVSEITDKGERALEVHLAGSLWNPPR